jgi:hypothetical protein
MMLTYLTISNSHSLFIIKACIIMHNVIIENEQIINDVSDIKYEQIIKTPCVQISHGHTPGLLEFIERHMNIIDGQTHSQPQSDLIKHIWQFHGQSYELLVFLYVSNCFVFLFT